MRKFSVLTCKIKAVYLIKRMVLILLSMVNTFFGFDLILFFARKAAV